MIGAIALAVVYGRVAVANLTYGVVGGNSNGYEDVWNDYWLKTALHLHRNPFYTDYLFAPNGVSLRFHTLNPFGGLIALPLSPLIGIVGAMNLKFLLALVGSVFFAYLLMRDLTGSPLAAFAGAALYTYANDQTVSYFSTGAENYLMGTALLPLFLFFLFRALARPRWWGYAAAATGTLLALCLTDWQYTMFAVLVTVAFVLFTLCTRQSWRAKAIIAGKAALIGGVWAAIVFLPLVLPMIRESRASPWLNVSGEATALSRSLVQSFQIGIGNPGYLALLLTIGGLALLWRRAAARPDRATVLFWALVAVFASILALGPRLKLTDGHIIDLPLPYDPLTRLPVFTAGRRPQLFYFIAMLAFGVLVAFALRELFIWLRRAHRAARGRRGIRPAVARRANRGRRGHAARLARALRGPHGRCKGVPAPDAALLSECRREGPGLVRDPRTAALLGGARHGLARQSDRPRQADLRWQPLARPQAGEPEHLRHARDLLSRLLLGGAGGPGGAVPPDQDAGHPHAARLRDLRAAAAELLPCALHRPLPRRTARHRARRAGELPANWSGRRSARACNRSYVDAITEVYRVPDAPPPANPVFMDIATSGWFPAQLTPTKEPYRWADAANGAPAAFLIFNLSQQRQRVSLRMTVQNYAQPRTVDAAINGYTLDHFTLDARGDHPVAVEFDVPPGMNTLTLSSPQPPVPVQEAGARDNRLLSFSVRGVQIATLPHTP